MSLVIDRGLRVGPPGMGVRSALDDLLVGFGGSSSLTRLPLHTLFVHVGDSICAGSTGISISITALQYTGGRLAVPPGGNQGVGGSKITDLNSRTASQDGSIAKTVTLSPKVVHMHVGTNDLGLGSDTPATIFANISTALDSLFAGGVQYVVLDTILPRIAPNALSSGRETDRQTLNTLIKGLSRTNVFVVDVEAGFDTATMLLDGLHLNRKGAYFCGQKIAAVLLNLVTTDSPLFVAGTDFGSWLVNAELTGTTGTKSGTGSTGNVATNWTAGSVQAATGPNIVCSKETLRSGVEKQVVTFGGTSASTANLLGLYKTGITVSVAVGEVTEAWAYVEWSGLQGVAAPFFQIDGVGFDNLSSITDAPPDFAGVIRLPRVSNGSAKSTSGLQIGFRPTAAGVTLGGVMKVSSPTYRKVA